MAEKIGDRRPKGWPEVYALEQIFLAAEPLTGKYVPVQVTRAGPNSLVGESMQCGVM